MKKVVLIHKEKEENCFEILKSIIVEDKQINKYRIDKETLLQELPENIVNVFLDFLGTDPQHRNLMLYMIKRGSLVIDCWEDEEIPDVGKRIKSPLKTVKEKYDDPFSGPIAFNSDVPF